MTRKALTADQAMARAKSCERKGETVEAIRLYSLISAQARPYKKAQEAIRKLRQPQSAIAKPLSKRTGAALLSLLTKGQNLEALEQTNLELINHPSDPLLYKIKGDIQLNLGDFVAALKSAELALSLMPQCTQAHTLSGMALLNLGRYDLAKNCFVRALENDDEQYDAHFNLGNCYKNLRKEEDAIHHYLRAKTIDPASADLHYNLGSVFLALDRFDEAEACYTEALRIDPEHLNARLRLGIVFKGKSDPKSSISCYEQVLRKNPVSFEAYSNLGIAHTDLDHQEMAVSSYLSALEIEPNHCETHNLLGVSYEKMGKLEDALACFESALNLKPDFSHALYNKGVIHKKLDQTEAAIRCYNEALEIEKHAQTYNVLGISLKEKGNYEAAISVYKLALKMDPEHVDALNNLGMVYAEMGILDKATNCHDKAMLLQPNSAKFHFTAACSYLLNSDFKRGWPLYERRFKEKGRSIVTHHTPHHSTRWKGESLEGKSIIILAEQGLGDLIQFVRYARHLKALGANVTLESKAALISLFKSIPYIDGIFSCGSALPPADFHCPIMSLPFVLEDMLDQPLAHTTPYLFADGDRVLAWEKRLKAMSGYRVGVSWQGSVTFNNDKWRSISLEEFAVFDAVPNVSLVSLQKGKRGVAQIPGFRKNHALLDVEELVKGDSDMMDAAAVIMNLDLVITCCTSIAHLAGALGVRTWVMLSKNAEWRWLLGRDDSPWYPTVRLFRQKTKGEWAAPFQQAALVLQGLSYARSLNKGKHPKPHQNPAKSTLLPTEPIFKPFQGQMNAVVTLFNAGDLATAKQHGATLAAAYPEAPVLQNLLGVIHSTLNDHQAAVGHFRAATRLVPSYAQALRNLSLSLRKLGLEDEANKRLANAVSLEQSTPETPHANSAK